MSETSQDGAEQAAAFQKIWAESVSKLLQTAFAFGSDSPPPEVLREIRSAIFQSLAKSWEEYLRSPQFLDGMRQWMDNAVAFRKLTNEFMANVRNETQAPSRDDVDTIMLAVRHMEKRLLDRIEEVAAQVSALQGGFGMPGQSPAKRTGKKPRKKAAQKRKARTV